MPAAAAVRCLTPSAAARRAPAALLLLALAAAGAACRDSGTGPDDPPPTRLTLSLLQVNGPEFAVGDSGRPVVRCAAFLQASVAAGRGATWLDARFRWFAGKDRRTAVDSADIPSTEIRESWAGPGGGSGQIAAGQIQQSGWQLAGGVPYTAEFEYRYQPLEGGPIQTATARFTCGPEPTAATPPPTISSVLLTPAVGLVEAGGLVDVTYSAASPVGLWSAVVAIQGPCELRQYTSDSLRTTITRTVRFRLPAECQLGQPITAAVAVFDAALQPASMERPTAVTIADRTPPAMQPIFFPQGVSGSAFAPSGDHFAGDTIWFVPNASDNHRLAWAVWDVPSSGVRDSAPLAGTATAPLAAVPIPLRVEMAGATVLRLAVRDAGGLTSNTVLSQQGNFAIYPTVVRPTAVASVAGEIDDAVVDARRGAIYLLQSQRSRVAVLSLATMQVTSVVTLPSAGWSFDLTAGGDSLLLTLPAQRALGVIDLRPATPALTIRQLTSLDATQNHAPRSLRVAANGRAFITVESSTGPNTLLELNLATGAERFRSDAGDGGGSIGTDWLERSPDRSALILTNAFGLQRYDAAADAFGARRFTGEPSSGNSVSADAAGQRIAIGARVFDASLQLLRSVKVAPPANPSTRTRLSPDGEYLYSLQGARGVVRARVSDGAIVDRAASPVVGTMLRISDDGTLLVAIETAPAAATSRVGTIGLR